MSKKFDKLVTISNGKARMSDELFAAIRDGKISKDDAVDLIIRKLAELEN
jgi:hypothetical protein